MGEINPFIAQVQEIYSPSNVAAVVRKESKLYELGALGKNFGRIAGRGKGAKNEVSDAELNVAAKDTKLPAEVRDAAGFLLSGQGQSLRKRIAERSPDKGEASFTDQDLQAGIKSYDAGLKPQVEAASKQAALAAPLAMTQVTVAYMNAVQSIRID